MARPDAHILLVTNNLPPVRGGSAIVYDNLARHSDAIRVIAPRLSYVDALPLIGWREHDRLAPYPVKRLDLLRTVMRRAVPHPAYGPSMPSWLQRLGFRMHDAWIRTRVTAAVARTLFGGPVRAVCVGELVASAWLLFVLRWCFPWVVRAVYIHGEEITTSYEAGRDRRRAGLLAAQHVIVVSRFTASAVAELLGPAAQGRVRLIENGVDSNRFRPVPCPAALQAQYGLEGSFVFISVCRLVEKKGIDNAIRAFATLAARHPDTRYLVVGDGDHRGTLVALAQACGLADKVVFTGSVADDELVQHYALGSVFIMPNRRLPDGDTEGFGLVFLEANACGLPVIAGSDGGSVDAVRDGDNGLLVDGHSVASIAGAMLRLREDAALRQALRDGGLRAATAANWQSKARAFVEILGS